MQPSKSIICTPSGDITVDLAPTQAFVDEHYRWPYGLALVASAAPGGRPRLALPMHDGDRVMMGFKLRQQQFTEREGELACYHDRAYVAAGVASLARARWRGTLVAGTYQRPRDSIAEVGMALFVVPELPYSAPGGAFEIAFKAAQWKTIERFITAFSTGYVDTEALPLQNIVAAEPCPATHMGYLAPLLMLHDGFMFALDSDLRDDDPLWGALARAGVLQLSWLPCVVKHHHTWEYNRP